MFFMYERDGDISLMIRMLHDLVYQNPKNYSSALDIR